MRVCMLSWEYPPRVVGGVARHCSGLAQTLVQQGHEVNMVTLEFPGAPTFEEIDGVRVYRVSIEVGHPNFLTWVFLFNHFMYKQAAKLCCEEKIDIIHAHDWLVAPSTISLKHSFNIPLISTIHSTETRRAQGLHNPDSFTIDGLEWWASYEANKVIVTTEAMKREVSGHFKLPEEKITTIPNGIYQKKFDVFFDRKSVRQKYVLPHEKIVLFVGRLTPQKGVEYLIQAVPSIIQRHHEAKIVVVGEGWLRDILEHLARSTGYQEKILFTGFLPEQDLLRIMLCANVLVLPSIYEPFGIVALEGMAAGIPVVASKTDGLAEVINHDVNGVLVYPRNPNSIAWGVNRVLSDPDYVQYLVRNAKDKLRKIYNWDAIAEKTIRVYEEAVRP